MIGRPTKISDEVTDIIVTAIRGGHYVEAAAAMAGVHKSTVYDWLKRGKRERARVEQNARFRVSQKEAPYVAFSDAVLKAEGEAELRLLNQLQTDSRGDWRAAAWRLERRFPKRWGYHARVSGGDPEEGDLPIRVEATYEGRVEASEVLVDQLARLLQNVDTDEASDETGP